MIDSSRTLRAVQAGQRRTGGPGGATAAPVDPGVPGPDVPDLSALATWLDAQGVGDGPLDDVRRLGGGTQNVLLAFTRGGARYVLRRPPPSRGEAGDATLRREARVLAALAGTAVPHARLVAACPGEGPLGVAFVVTEQVDGVALWDEVPAAYATPQAQHRAGLAVAAAFGTLARVDVAAAGLADLGRTAGWLARQADRWRGQLDSYAAVDGRRGERLPGADELHAWLVATQPADWSPGLLHGDAHLGNVLLARDGTGVLALVDWELATLGDPLLDLGELLATWPVPGGVYGERLDAPGLPEPVEVAAHWAATAGRSVAGLPWFRVLAGYRLAVLLEGSQARARAGLAPATTGATLHRRACALVHEAALAAGG